MQIVDSLIENDYHYHMNKNLITFVISAFLQNKVKRSSPYLERLGAKKVELQC